MAPQLSIPASWADPPVAWLRNALGTNRTGTQVSGEATVGFVVEGMPIAFADSAAVNLRLETGNARETGNAWAVLVEGLDTGNASQMLLDSDDKHEAPTTAPTNPNPNPKIEG